MIIYFGSPVTELCIITRWTRDCVCVCVCGYQMNKATDAIEDCTNAIELKSFTIDKQNWNNTN